MWENGYGPALLRRQRLEVLVKPVKLPAREQGTLERVMVLR